MSTYPTVRPSLTLDFQKSKQLDPRISFSRSSSATYVEGGVIKYADEHQARFEEEGLLLEESRTNNVVYSVPLTAGVGGWFVFSGWAHGQLTLNQAIAPDGTNNAVKYTPNASNDPCSALQYTGGMGWSIFVKKINCNQVQILASGYSTCTYSFDTDTFNPGNTPSAWSYLESEIYPNGWVRLMVGFKRTSGGANNPAVFVQGIEADGYTFGNDAFYAWGLQAESISSGDAVDFPTSYIPTSGSTATRAADVAQITGDNFTSWYNQSEGTLTVTAKTYDNNYTPLPLAFIHQDGSNSYQFSYQSQTTYFPRVSAGNYTITVDSSANSRDNCKIAGVYGPNSSGDFTAAVGVNGSAFERASPLVPNVIAATSLKIGSNHGNTLYANTTLARLSYYSERLTDEQLEVLTS